MKKSIVVATLAALFSITAVQAQQAATLAQAATAIEKTPKLLEFDKQVQQVQEHSKKCMSRWIRMDKISKTQNPQERQRLLKKHLATMQSGMRAYPKPMPEQIKQRQDMMDQMRQHQNLCGNIQKNSPVLVEPACFLLV